VGPAALLAHGHEADVPEVPEVTRCGRLRHAQDPDEIADARLPKAEDVQDPEPRRIGECLEQRGRHHIRVTEYMAAARREPEAATIFPMKNAQSLIGRLERGAGAIRALVSGMDDEEARWRLPSGGWSILEVVCHLKDEETDDFRQRLRLTLEDPEQDWPPMDPEAWVTERGYQKRALGPEIDAFLAERGKSLEWLRGLVAPDWSRAHSHPRFGSMRAGDLLAAWVVHDLLHVRQIARLQYEHARALAEPYRVDYAGLAPEPPRL